MIVALAEAAGAVLERRRVGLPATRGFFPRLEILFVRAGGLRVVTLGSDLPLRNLFRTHRGFSDPGRRP